jgi:hypothetical protein
MTNLKILIDEMDDGWDEKLQLLGFDAYSVKKLRAEACQENNLPYILLDNEEIFKIVLDKINKL